MDDRDRRSDRIIDWDVATKFANEVVMAPVAADALRKSHADWSAWRNQNRGARHDLSGGAFTLDGTQGPWDLSNCDLSKCMISSIGALVIDVSGSNLSDASFASGSMLPSVRVDKSTVLDRTRFDGATLSGSDFSPVELNGTSFFRTIVRSVKFGSRLIDVNLGRASLKDADFRDAELRGCSLASAQATDCHFDNAKFTVAPASKNATTLEMAAFRGCSFLDANFGGCSLASALFIDSDLRRTTELRLDKTILRGSLQSAGADDHWSVLRRSYTGANMVFNVFAMVIFFTPWVFQALYWSGVNQAELGVLRGLAAAEAELAKFPDEERRRLVLTQLRRSIDPELQRCLRPSASADKSTSPGCRPIWQILVGAHEGWLAVVLGSILIVYNIARLGLTWVVAPLRDEEIRTWHAPSRESYGWLMGPHYVVRKLVWVAIAAAVLHLGPMLLTPVWLMSSVT